MNVQEIAIVEGLETEIIELKVAFRLERCGEAVEVEAAEFRIEQLILDSGPDIVAEIVAIAGGHLGLCRLLGSPRDESQRLTPQLVVEKARAHPGVIRLCLDQRAGGEDRRERQFVFTDAVKEIAMGLVQHVLRRDAVQIGAGLANDSGETRGV